jgi:hypothetical protein
MALFPVAGSDENNVPLLFFRSQAESGAISRIFAQVYLLICLKPSPVTDQPSGPISQMDRRYLRREVSIARELAIRARPFGFIPGQNQTTSLRG